MTLFINLSNSLDPNTLSIGFLGSLTCFIGYQIAKSILLSNNNSANITLETPTTDTGVDTIRALSSNIPSPTIQTHSESTIHQLITTNLPSDGINLEQSLGIMSRDIIDLQSRIETLTQIVYSNIETTKLFLKIIPKVIPYPDHPSYLVYMAQNPLTDTVRDIVASGYF